MRKPRVKQPEELLAMGGRFYAVGEQSWCDTAAESWLLVPGRGYVEQFDSGEKCIMCGANEAMPDDDVCLPCRQDSDAAERGDP